MGQLQQSEIMKKENTYKFDSEKAWTKLYSKLESEDLLKPNEHNNRTLSNLYRPLAAAAAIIIIVAIGTTLLRSGDITISNSTPNIIVQSLSDGSTIYLSENAEIVLERGFSKKNRSITLSGEAFFDIKRNEQLPFIITTQSATIEVLGTAFKINDTGKSEFKLTVERGKVSVTSNANHNVKYTATKGEQVQLHSNKWTKGEYIADSKSDESKVQFRDATIETIVSYVNKRYSTKILAQKEIANERITLTITNETPQTIVELICSAINAHQQTNNEQIIITE